MKIISNQLPINLYVIFYGIVTNYLRLEDAIEITNTYNEILEISSDSLYELNINDKNIEHFLAVLKPLIKASKSEQKLFKKIVRLSNLIDIQNSNILSDEKLKIIAECWMNYDYPAEWKRFIYYMPSTTQNSSNQDLYKYFLDFIKQEKEFLSKISI